MTRSLPLSPEQRAAVDTRDGPVLLSAAAGSGKTAVLVERFVAAVREDGLAPGRILAVTFTERAAAELRERVRARLLALGERTAARDTEAAIIGTFHGFCARLLRTHALAADLDPEFAILDEPLARQLRGLAFRESLRELMGVARAGAHAARGGDPYADDAVDLLAAYGVPGVRTMILGVHAELRSRGEAEPRLPSFRSSGSDVPEVDLRARAALGALDVLLGSFSSRYAELKRRRRALDFDDLELAAGRLLGQRPEVRRSWSERLQLLMVDEFQDTNRRQLRILELLENENLFTVGDELQSIYGFRHADPRIFRERRRELARSGRSLRLAVNFRSRPSIIAAVNAVFGERFGGAASPLRAARLPAPDRVCPDQGCESRSEAEPAVELLLSARQGWDAPGLRERVAGSLPAAPAWRQAEARLLAQRIAELLAPAVIRGSEVVLLLRSLADIALYEGALGERGRANPGECRELLEPAAGARPARVPAPARESAGRARPVRDPRLALRRALGRWSVSCWPGQSARARANPTPGGPATLWALASDPPAELLERLARADREPLERFADWITAERRAAARLGPAELIERSVRHSGYDLHVLSLSWPERRLANVHKLARLARRFEAAEGGDLRGFLDYASEQREPLASSEPAAAVAELEPDAVRLMSVHAAKGLEFPVVCLADLGRAVGPRQPNLLVNGARVGLRLATLDGSAPVPALDYEELAAERRAGEAEEEERILYVAMTRARERLVLSGAADLSALAPAERPGAAPIDWLAPALLADLPGLLARHHPGGCEDPPPSDHGEVPAGQRLSARCPCAATRGCPSAASSTLPRPSERPCAGVPRRRRPARLADPAARPARLADPPPGRPASATPRACGPRPCGTRTRCRPRGGIRGPHGPLRAPQGPLRDPQGPLRGPQGPIRGPQLHDPERARALWLPVLPGTRARRPPVHSAAAPVAGDQVGRNPPRGAEAGERRRHLSRGQALSDNAPRGAGGQAEGARARRARAPIARAP